MTDNHPETALPDMSALDVLKRLRSIWEELRVARSAQDAASIVVDHAMSILGGNTCTIMLVSEEGEWLDMVASRGLPPVTIEGFGRIPLDGKMPVQEVVSSGTSVWISSIAERDLVYPDLRGVAVAGKSWGVVPLEGPRGAIGVLSISFDHERSFSATEREFIVGIVRQFSQVIGQLRVIAQLDRQSAIQRAELDVAPHGVLVVSDDGRVLIFNTCLFDLLDAPDRCSTGDQVGAWIIEVAQVAREPEQFQMLVGLLLSGDETGPIEAVMADGRVLELQGRAVRVSELGDPFGHALFVRDVTFVHRTKSRLEYLADASRVLSQSLELSKLVEEVAELLVPRLGTTCLVEAPTGLVGHDRYLLHIEADGTRHVSWLGSSNDDSREELGITQREQLTSVEELELPRDVESFVRTQGIPTAAVASLDVRGRTIGRIFVMGSHMPLTNEDVRVIQQLADRAAVAMDNALVHASAVDRARAALVLRHISDGVVLLDPHGELLLWNPGAERITGIVEQDVQGRVARDVVPWWGLIEQQFPPGEMEPERSIGAVPIQVGDREVWISATAVHFPRGSAYTFRDVSEERALQRMRDDLVATVSHELRTPLASVYGAALTLQRRDLPGDDATRERLLDMIACESDRLAGIIDDILIASQLDSGRIQLRNAAVDVRQLVCDVVNGAHAAHNVDATAVVAVVPAGPVMIVVDGDRLRQVVVNLVENAIKYSAGRVNVSVGLEVIGTTVHLWVRDQGIGIPPHEHARIFEKFYRLDPGLAGGVGGTGLGLSISRELVHRMGGRMWLDSKVGVGSTFHMELPGTLADLET